MTPTTRLSPEELENIRKRDADAEEKSGPFEKHDELDVVKLISHIAALEEEIRSLTPLSDERRKEIKKENRKRLKEFKL